MVGTKVGSEAGVTSAVGVLEGKLVGSSDCVGRIFHVSGGNPPSGCSVGIKVLFEKDGKILLRVIKPTSKNRIIAIG